VFDKNDQRARSPELMKRTPENKRKPGGRSQVTQAEIDEYYRQQNASQPRAAHQCELAK
jgi:hypothetical protein